MTLFAPTIPACEFCGPLEPPQIHAVCHATRHSRQGCGHALADHAASLKCRVCKRECGIDCSRVAR